MKVRRGGRERLPGWGLLAVGTALLGALLWIGAGCATENTTGDMPSGATVHTTLTAPPPSTPAVAELVVEDGTPAESAAYVAPTGSSKPGDNQTQAATTKSEAPVEAMTAADFPAPPERDLRLLAQQMRWKGETPPAAESTPIDLQVGDVRDFWTLDYPAMSMVSSRFRLVAISDGAYWWASEDADVDDESLSRTVEGAERQVFPQVATAFASGDEPGWVHIISGRIPGVGGYVSGSDQYPSNVSPYSNEVPAIYINTRAATFGDRGFLHILAHELQHVLHQEADESESTWLNEGLSELAVTEAGYSVGSIYRYLRRPNASLVNWPDHLGADVGLNYGAAALFAHYLAEKYAPDGRLQDLLAIEADGIAAVDEFLHRRNAVVPNGGTADFHTLFADWMVANRLDLDSGPHGYAGLDVEASITHRTEANGEGFEASLAQYGVDYIEVQDAGDVAAIHFEGSAETPLLPTDVAGECWWSNRGDSISATLTRDLTVPASAYDDSEPRLKYRYWHDIEEEWDYLYVSASVDGGETWDVLHATGTTDANPVGNSYGYGYTGESDGWRDGSVSLAQYAGAEVSVRFHYVTDDAINGPGMCVQDIRVAGDPEENGSGNWVAEGFVSVNNRVRQDWIVWVIAEGREPSATRLELDWDAELDRFMGSMPVDVAADERLVVVVAPVAPATMEEGDYRLRVESDK